MRDYIFTRGSIGTAYMDDGINPTMSLPMYALGANDENLLLARAQREQRILADFPPPAWDDWFTWNDPFTMYFLLDKPSLMTIFNTYEGFGEIFITDALFNSPQLFNTKIDPEESPREWWHGNEWDF